MLMAIKLHSIAFFMKIIESSVIHDVQHFKIRMVIIIPYAGGDMHEQTALLGRDYHWFVFSKREIRVSSVLLTICFV
jgi:hypothetical protein